MRIIYLFIIFFLFHCSGGLEFSQLPQEGAEYSTEQSLITEEDGVRCDKEDCTAVETFNMEASEIEVNIIFVLDVSTSMKKNLEKLGSSMRSFLSHIKDFKWSMSFTTADHGDHVRRSGRVSEQDADDYSGDHPHFGRLMQLEYRGKLIPDTILHKNNEFLDALFYDTLTLNRENTCSLPPFCQGDHEQPLRSLKAAIEIRENQDFFTSDNVVAMIITNEDERDEDKSKATTAKEVLQSFNSNFPDKNLYGFGISIQDESCYKSQKSKSKVAYGDYVQELAQITQGYNVSICESDYGPSLADISRIIRSRILGNQVSLKSGVPQKGSVEIEINPVQNTRWKVQGRKVIFTPALKEGTLVSIKYRVK